MTLMQAIYDRLMDAPAVAALVGHNVFASRRPADGPLPCIVFWRVSSISQNCSTGPTGTEQSRVQVDCHAALHEDAEELAAAIKGVLAGWSRESSPSIGAAQIVSEHEDFVDDTDGGGGAEHIISQDYSIWHSE